MNRAKVLILAALAIEWAAFLALSPTADARPVNAATAWSSVQVSDDAKAIAGLMVLVCANSGACMR